MFFVSTWALLYVGWVSASSRSRLRSLACELLRIWKERQQAVFLCFWEGSAYLTAVHIGVQDWEFQGPLGRCLVRLCKVNEESFQKDGHGCYRKCSSIVIERKK